MILLNRFLRNIQTKIKKKSRCSRCLSKDHLSWEDNALCKDKTSVFKEQVIVDLAEIDIFWDEQYDEEYQSDDSDNEKYFSDHDSVDDDSKN